MLEELSIALDDQRLTDWQKEKVATIRQRCQLQLYGGEAFHRFCLAAPEGTAGDAIEADIDWHVHCSCCGQHYIAEGSNDLLFLNNFWHWHLGSKKHDANAHAAAAAHYANLRDTAAAAAAAAQEAAAAGIAARDDVAAAERLAAVALAASERAAEAALAASTEAKAEAASLPRGTILPDVIEQPSPLATLVRESPALELLQSEAGSTCVGISCLWCRKLFQLTGEGHGTEAQVLQNVRGHLTSKDHRERASYGGRTMKGSFFGAPVKGPAPPPPPLPDRSRLCGGYHFMQMEVGGRKHAPQTIELRELLTFEVQPSSRWFPEPHFKHSYTVKGGEGASAQTVQIHGTFRSRRCTRFCVGLDGQPMKDAICQHCRAIPTDAAFRMLATRRAADRARDERKIRFDYLTPERRLAVMRALAAKVRELKSAVWLMRANYLRKCARVRKLEERLDEFASRGDVKALISDVISIERAGKWKERPALFEFIRDLVRSYKLRDGAEGKHSKGMRWHTASKRIFCVLRKYGGPRTLRFLHETLETPAESTVKREWRKDKVHFCPGAQPSIFEAVGKVYAAIKQQLGIVGPVFYELSEDETTVPGASQYNQRLDSIVGFCGRKGPGHTCDAKHCIVIGTGDDAYKIIENAWATQQLAGYLRLMVVNPLHDKLPSLSVMAHATCNRFNASWIRNDWVTTKALALKYISPHLGFFKGRGSDGDARRFKNQQADMAVAPDQPGRFGLLDEATGQPVEGFTQSARLEDGVPTDIHAQDYRHNEAKLMSHADNAARVLKFGRDIVTHQDIRRVFDAFAYSEHGLSAAAVDRADTMNKGGPADCCGLKAQACLRRLANGEGEGVERPEARVRTTLSYVKMVSRYLIMHMGEKATLIERVKHAAFVIDLLRRARGHVHNTSGLTLKENFMPRQTYSHVILDCFNCVLTILAQGKCNAALPVCLGKSGSNCCEEAFSECGGFGRLASRKRNYTINDALEALGDVNTIIAYAHDPEARLRFGSRNHRQDIDITKHEDQSRPDANLASHATRAEYVAAWRAGREEARQEAESLGMKPSGGADWWEKPWEGEAEQVREMRSAEKSELGGEAPLEGVDDEGNAFDCEAKVPVDVESHPDLQQPDGESEVDDGSVADAAGGVDGGADTDGDDDAGDDSIGSSFDSDEPPAAPQDGGAGHDFGVDPELGRVNESDVRDFEAALMRLEEDAEREFEELMEDGFQTTAGGTSGGKAGGEGGEGSTMEGEGSEASARSCAAPPAAAAAPRAQQAAAKARPRVDPCVPLPGGGRGYKRTVVAEFNRVNQGERLSPDRLQRVRQGGEQEAANQRGRRTVHAASKPANNAGGGATSTDSKPASSPRAEPEPASSTAGSFLRVGDDLAMLFKESGEYTWWIGRVTIIFRKGSRGGFKLLDLPVSLEEKPKDVHIVASWYRPTTATRTEYEFDVLSEDDAQKEQKWSLGNYIGSPILVWDAGSERYKLESPEETLTALDRALEAAKPEREGSTRTKGEAEKATQQRAATAATAAFDAPKYGTSGRDQRAARQSQVRDQVGDARLERLWGCEPRPSGSAAASSSSAAASSSSSVAASSPSSVQVAQPPSVKAAKKSKQNDKSAAKEAERDAAQPSISSAFASRSTPASNCSSVPGSATPQVAIAKAEAMEVDAASHPTKASSATAVAAADAVVAVAAPSAPATDASAVAAAAPPAAAADTSSAATASSPAVPAGFPTPFNTDCPCCLDPVGANGNGVAELMCGHALCVSCFEDYRRNRRTSACPECRSNCLRDPLQHCPTQLSASERQARLEVLKSGARKPHFTCIYPVAVPSPAPSAASPAADELASLRADDEPEEARSNGDSESDDSVMEVEAWGTTNQQMFGSLSSLQPLAKVQATLRLPEAGERQSMLASLEATLTQQPTRLQPPQLTRRDRVDIRDAQLVSTDPSRQSKALRCDGVAPGGVTVSREDFAVLRHQRDVAMDGELYLKDNIVDAWGQCLRQTEGGKHAVYFWPSTDVQIYMGYSQGHRPSVQNVARHARDRKRNGMDLLTMRAWVLPRVRGRHWTAVLVDFTSKQVLYADSLGGSAQDMVDRVCCVMEVVSQTLTGRAFSFDGWKRGSLGPLAPQQPDFFNCALFPMMLARCIHHDVKISRRWSSEQLDEYRDVIVLELFKERLLSFVA